jgi:hypothetical protein
VPSSAPRRRRHPRQRQGDGRHDTERGRAVKLFKGVEDAKGRWRGGPILGTSEIRYEDWPTTEDVLEKGTDISDKVIRYPVAISHY